MCLFSSLILNKKYLPTKKNGYRPPTLLDQRLKYVAVGCGQCIECKRQKARGWQVRLHEEAKTHKYKVFCTFSFSPQALQELTQKYELTDTNDVATKAMRLFLERYRKKKRQALRHWFVTELGHTNTERIHLHGIIFSDTPINTEELTNIWSYGNTYIGDYCSERTINYIIKYITKIDTDHIGYNAKILTSAGIGRNYTKTANARSNKYQEGKTREFYTLNNGAKINLPIYYRNKIYTEEEREKLWQEKLDKQEIWVMGQRIDISTDEGIKQYEEITHNSQILNRLLGYGDNTDEWRKKRYFVTLKMLNSTK